MLAAATKAGKTTLVRSLLSAAGTSLGALNATGDRDARRRGDYRTRFLGRLVDAAKALVISEESRAAWVGRPSTVDVRHLDGKGPVPRKGWDGYVKGLGRLAEVKGYDLIVLDAVFRLASADENSAHQVTRLMTPLRGLVAGNPGLAVLVLHHMSKDASAAPGLNGRGSTALQGQCDAVIEVAHVTPDPADTRRSLTVTGRSPIRRAERLVYRMADDGSLVLDATEKPAPVKPVAGKGKAFSAK